MRRFIIRRAIQSLLLLLAISFIGFMIIHLAPGGPEVKFMMDPRMTPADIRNIREHYGLTDPLPVQYAKWLWNALHLDLGVSYESLYPVTTEIVKALPNTLLLITAGMVLGLLGVPIGIYIALRRGSFVDNLVRVLTVAGSSIPHWWFGLLILLITSNIAISTGIKILPLPGYNEAEANNPLYQVWQLVLPSILIALAGWLTYSRITRTQVLDILSQDYVRTAHSKGLSQREVNRHHILRNALIPIITAFGANLPALIGGSIIFEEIFSLPGIGKLTIDSLTRSDYPVAIGILMFVSTVSVVALFLCDILYAVVDPRVRY
ncbi:MAG TPA: ABC transporter permease [Chloroflexia bacterium]|nr:ABC transporter permease [Chloroflexia bacterium]